MAKRKMKSGKKENKSATIRDYIKTHSDAGPTAIASTLNSEHGWSISPAYVSTIKNKMHAKRSGKRRTQAAARSAGTGGVSETALLQAKKLAEQIGGISEARAALDLLGRLTG